jgi:two-component system, LuxR family, response regulator FixJ
MISATYSQSLFSDLKSPSHVVSVEPEIFLIDSDRNLSSWLSGLVGSVGGRVSSFARLGQFLAEVGTNQCGCVAMDVPRGEAGAWMKLLRDRGYRQPVLMLADDGTIADAVSAIKAGAHDFLLKPPNAQVMLETLQSAWRSELERADRDRQISIWRDRFGCLSPREHQVLRCIIRGLISKEIGNELGISPRTVDAHRSAILRKLGGARISELVGMYMLIHADAADATFAMVTPA